MAATIKDLGPLTAEATQEAKALGGVAAVAAFPTDFCKVWPVIKKALELAMIFTPPSVDKVIQAFIKGADQYCGGSGSGGA